MTTAVKVPDYVREYGDLRIEFFDGKGSARRYLISCPSEGIDRERFTSVTTITGCFEKEALKYSAQKIGVEGAIALAADGFLPTDPDAALGEMKKRGLQFWQIWGQKADWGTLAHKDLIALAAGELVDLDKYPSQVQGFVKGISAWMADYSPKVLEAEVPVASVKHRIAGRFDWLVEIEHPFLGRGIVDLKTTEKLPKDRQRRLKPPYEEHAIQVKLYDVAAQECDYPPTDFQGILRVDQAGDFDFTISWVTEEQALGAIAGYRAISSVRSAAPKPRAV